MIATVAAGIDCGSSHPVSVSTPAQTSTALQRLLYRYVAARPWISGAAVSITAPGRALAFRGAAGRQAFHQRPLTADDPFRIASVTKTFTASAVLRLVEDGRLGLDDAADRYLSAAVVADISAAGGFAAGRTVTVRNLLNHTSGLYDYGTDRRWLLQVATHPHRQWTPTQLLDFALRHGHPYAEPGGQFAYSDTGYVLLGLIVEHLTGRPLAEAYRQLLPLHLLPATYLEGREPPPVGARPRAHQYLGPLDTTAFDPSFDTAGGGGLVSTISDLDNFARALFHGGVFHTRGALDQMLATIPDGHGSDYGLGIGRRRMANQDVWLHTGFFGSALAYVPALDLSIGVTTSQATSNPETLLTRIIQAIPAPARTPARR